MAAQPSTVYEWYRFEEVPTGAAASALGGVGTLYNPPFRAGPAGVQLAYHMGGPIIRGFIKRSNVGSAPPANDPGAQGRCYFMFNPTSLSQGFTYDTSIYNPSQASQADLNTAPYGQAAFNFALFFERTAEVNANPDNAGTLVDLDVLSYIVRGVPANLASPGGLAGATSGDPRLHINNSTSASVIADPTGTFIGQGQTIDAVFSKYMTMRGTVNSLTIDFLKFSHNMIPTLMTVNIGMLLQSQNVGTTNNTGGSTDANGGTSATSVVGDPSNRFSRGVVTPV